jgi:hypothetical protein
MLTRVTSQPEITSHTQIGTRHKVWEILLSQQHITMAIALQSPSTSHKVYGDKNLLKQGKNRREGEMKMVRQKI